MPHRHAKDAHGDADAAESLMVLKAGAELCPVCSRNLGTPLKDHRPLQQRQIERGLVKHLRHHCFQHHRGEFLWVAVPQNGIVRGEQQPENSGAPKTCNSMEGPSSNVEEVLLHAMSLSVTEWPYRQEEMKAKYWEFLSVHRMTFAMAWTKYRSHSLLQRKECNQKLRLVLRERCLVELEKIHNALLSQVAESFAQGLHLGSPARWKNLYQLIFVERGRYVMLYKDGYFSTCDAGT